jgi:predicted aminopeptidase
MDFFIRIIFKFSPVIITAALLLTVCFSCSGCYSLKQGTALIGYLNRAVPLEKLLNNDKSEALFAVRAADIREFAIRELGLNDSKNYTRYVQLDRDYLAAVVSACAKDSFTSYEWKYPIVGKMPYKGFFNVKDAKKESEKLEKKDLDVWVRGVDAFSTLGWFRDPLYSYMRGYSAARLADLIIHELLHATVFIKGQVQFNEELAEFIGSEGSRLYIESRFGIDSDEYREISASSADNKVFINFIQELTAELDELYKSDLGREGKLREKERVIQAAQKRFDAEYDSLFSNDDYRGFSERKINNAYLDLFRLYHDKDNYFADLYESSQLDLAGFINVVKNIKKGDPRPQLEKALGIF